jgi:hypothetical protein
VLMAFELLGKEAFDIEALRTASRYLARVLCLAVWQEFSLGFSLDCSTSVLLKELEVLQNQGR